MATTQRSGWWVISLLALGLLLLTGCAGKATGRPLDPSPTSPPPRPTATLDANRRMLKLRFVDAQVGWAAGANRVVRTTDGARHWSDVTPAGATTTQTPFFLDATTAWVVAPASSGQTLTIFHTTNGGQSWRSTQLDAGNPRALTFVDAQRGWLVANTQAYANHEVFDLFNTTDAGATWTKLASAGAGDFGLPAGGSKNGPTFLNATTGWFGGSIPVDSQYRFYRSDDGGAHWAPQALPPPSPAIPASQPEILAPMFLSAQEGVLPALFHAPAAQQTVIYVTRDGGATWVSTAPIATGAGTPVIAFATLATGWALAPAPGGAALYVTGDGGAHWNAITPQPPFTAVADAQLLSPSLGYVACDAGVLRTTDGGRTWADATPA